MDWIRGSHESVDKWVYIFLKLLLEKNVLQNAVLMRALYRQRPCARREGKGDARLENESMQLETIYHKPV